MEHRASLVVGLLGFGFVAFVLIKLASQINTHPDLDHFTPPPKRAFRGGARLPPTPSEEQRRLSARELATMELLVDTAARQYVDRARMQYRQRHPGVPEGIPCELRERAPIGGRGELEGLGHGGPEVWRGTFRCMNEKVSFEINFFVNFTFENGRWEFDAETQKALSEGGYLPVSWRGMTDAEYRQAWTPDPRPTVVFPERFGR